MGLKKATVKLGADISDFTSKMQKASASFKKLNRGIKDVGKSMSISLTAPLTAFAAASVNAFDTQAKAEAKLLTALKGNKDAFKDLTDSAQKFQELSLFGDEQIIAQQAYLASLGLTTDQIKEVISASMDLAAGTGQTLEFGVRNLAKTFSGLTGELGESIPALKELTTEELIAGGAVKIVADAFEGQARAASEAGLGGVQQLKNSFGDLTEEIGRGLMPILKTLTDRIKIVIDSMKTLTAAQIESKIQIGLFVAAIGPVLYALGQFFDGATKVYKVLKFLASSIIIPVVIGAIDLLVGALAVAIATFGGPVVAGVTLLAAAFTSLAHTFITANDELVKFNSTQAESLALTKQQSEAIDNTMIPFIHGTKEATKRTKELGIQLQQVAQVTSVSDESLGGGLIRVNHALQENSDSMSMLGQKAMNTFSMMADRVLNFKGTFVDALRDIIKQLGKMILKTAIMAGFLSLISGGAGGVGVLGVGGGLSFGEAFTQGLTGRASGGFVNRKTPYMVGERGPELFVPSSSGSIVANHNLGGSSIPDVRISGDDLLIVFDRANRRKARR